MGLARSSPAAALSLRVDWKGGATAAIIVPDFGRRGGENHGQHQPG